MSRRSRRACSGRLAAAWAVAVIVIAGCGTAGDSNCRVAGQVTYQGQPVSRAVISFFPRTGRPTGGPLDDDGRYAVDLPSGEYQVIVNAPTLPPPGWQEGEPLPPQEPRIPPRFAQRERSGLTAEIPADQSRLELDFPLE